jgi:lysophospholipase L1-like esterase
MKTYLALGDSYTIGEQVILEENFPNQAVAMLKGKVAAPQIIATTGWTTDELYAAINEANITATFDIVTLLIGVNNQYRGKPLKNFVVEFEHLLQRAIQFANNISNHVIVLSIPDWSVTPFAEDRDRQKIAEEIDAYNLVCKNAAQKFKTHYIDITTSQRLDGNKDEFLAADKLHPSGKEYKKWAEKVAAKISEIHSL